MVEVTPLPDHFLPELDHQLIQVTHIPACLRLVEAPLMSLSQPASFLQVNQLTVDGGDDDEEAELDLSVWPMPSSDVTCFSK